jgi:magnesium-transporting ATPase (P-type)
VVTGAIPRRKRPSLWNRNQKYSIITFIPLVLFNQFKFFLNLFFLIMACSQFIPVLRSAVDILANMVPEPTVPSCLILEVKSHLHVPDFSYFCFI